MYAETLESNRDDIAVFIENRDRCKSDGDRAFEIYGLKHWNKLPLYIKKETKFPNFKKKFKNIFI